MAANIVPTSFKNNPFELHMYNYLKSKSSPSSYVKEMLEKDDGFVEYMCTVDKEYALRYGKKIEGDSKDDDKPKEVENKNTPVNNITNMSSVFK